MSLLHEEHVLVVHEVLFSRKESVTFELCYLADEDTLNTAFDCIDSFLSATGWRRSHEVIPTGYSDEEVAARIFNLLGFHTVSKCRDIENPANLSMNHAIPFLLHSLQH